MFPSIREPARHEYLPNEILAEIAQEHCHTLVDATNFFKSVYGLSDTETIKKMQTLRLNPLSKAVEQARAQSARPDKDKYSNALATVQAACIPPYRVPELSLLAESDTSSSLHSNSRTGYWRGYLEGTRDCRRRPIFMKGRGASRVDRQSDTGLVLAILCIQGAFIVGCKAYLSYYKNQENAILARSAADGRLTALKTLEASVGHLGLTDTQRADIVDTTRRQVSLARKATARTVALACASIGFVVGATVLAGLYLGGVGACLVGIIFICGVTYPLLHANTPTLPMTLQEAQQTLYDWHLHHAIDEIDHKVRHGVIA